MNEMAKERVADERIRLRSTSDSTASELGAKLPSTETGLLDHARECLHILDGAITAGLEIDAQRALDRYNTVVWVLNNRTFCGSYAENGSAGWRVESYCANDDGREPLWGQKGAFLIELDGTLAIVRTTSHLFVGMQKVTIEAVEFDKPFANAQGELMVWLPILSEGSVGTGARKALADALDSQAIPLDRWAQARCRRSSQLKWVAECRASMFAESI